MSIVCGTIGCTGESVRDPDEHNQQHFDDFTAAEQHCQAQQVPLSNTPTRLLLKGKIRRQTGQRGIEHAEAGYSSKTRYHQGNYHPSTGATGLLDDDLASIHPSSATEDECSN